MPDRRAQDALDLWQHLHNQAALWHPVQQEIAELVAPRKSNILKKESPGQRQTNKLFDATAPLANELLAASIQGSLTSNSLRWFSLRIRGLDLDEEHEINIWLEQCSDAMYDALRQSNFQSESHEMYADIAAFGTGAVFEDAIPARPRTPWMGVRFQALPPGSYAIDEDAEGRVNVVGFMHKLSARAARARWGDRLSPQVLKAAEGRQDKFQLFDFLHLVMPREGTNYDPLNGARTPARKLPWASIWVDVAGERTLSEGGFHEFPFMVPRWAKSSGEVYGRGPGYLALPDIKTLNKVVELKLKALAKIVNPPTKVLHDGVLGAVDLTSGGLTYVYDMNAVDSMNLRIELDKVSFEEEKLKEAIRRAFFSDQLQLQSGPQMTATEVQVRFELMQRILGPTLGRLETEWLDPLINRTFWIMFRAGALPPMPSVLEDMIRDGLALDIEYEGALARAQRLSDTIANQRLLQMAVPIIQLDPEAADVLNTDELIRDTAINVGAKAKVIRSESDVLARRQKREQEKQQQLQAQQMMGAAEAIGKAAPGMKALGELQPPLTGAA